MKIWRWLPAVLALLSGGCGTAPEGAEATREIVLQYVGRDVGTVGPFAKHAQHELALLSASDRSRTLALMDQGAVGFLVIERDPANANRLILIAGKKVVGDFPAAKSEPSR